MGSGRLFTMHMLITFRFGNSSNVLEGDEGFGIAVIAQDRASVDIDLDDPSFHTWCVGTINADNGALTIK